MERTEQNRTERNSIEMGLFLTVFLISSSLLSPLASTVNHYRPYSTQKVTYLHFYLHDTLSGQNPTAVQVAQPNKTVGAPSATPFGTVFVIDDPLTSTPEITPDTVVGSAQGMYISTGKEKLTLLMAVDYTFTAGEHNGSSFSVVSRNPVSEGDRELAVVGGRGKFRLARGFAELKTHSLNMTNGDAVIEYNVTVLHH